MAKAMDFSDIRLPHGKTVEDLITEVRKWARRRGREAFWFGSRSRGTHRKNSDYDLGLIAPTRRLKDLHGAATLRQKYAARSEEYKESNLDIFIIVRGSLYAERSGLEYDMRKGSRVE